MSEVPLHRSTQSVLPVNQPQSHSRQSRQCFLPASQQLWGYNPVCKVTPAIQHGVVSPGGASASRTYTGFYPRNNPLSPKLMPANHSAIGATLVTSGAACQNIDQSTLFRVSFQSALMLIGRVGPTRTSAPADPRPVFRLDNAIVTSSSSSLLSLQVLEGPCALS